jgi:hypothetical protein
MLEKDLFMQKCLLRLFVIFHMGLFWKMHKNSILSIQEIKNNFFVVFQKD